MLLKHEMSGMCNGDGWTEIKIDIKRTVFQKQIGHK